MDLNGSKGLDYYDKIVIKGFTQLLGVLLVSRAMIWLYLAISPHRWLSWQSPTQIFQHKSISKTALLFFSLLTTQSKMSDERTFIAIKVSEFQVKKSN